jgi:hypothetical protein
MQQSRRVLFGDDPIAGLAIDPSHVRHALERELKGKALALRDQYVIAAGNRRLILDLMSDALPTFLILFRTALRLFEPQVPAIKVEALRSLARHISFDPQPYLTVQEFLDGRRGTSRVDSLALFRGYLSGIETIIHHVDQLLHEPHANSSHDHSGLVV